ncbi:MAG TPA: sugar ABC transporter ATP-binding protein, partial [Abditibacteriaceae bacterium]
MLIFTDISKRFGGVQALQTVSFEIARGTIHAIVGENGAGKSTLMKILCGIYAPDTGTITLDGKEVTIPTPRRARELGIALVPQEPALCPNLTVEENLSLGYEPSAMGFINRGAVRKRAEAALKRAALPTDPGMLVERLSAAQKHLLQIARALAEDAKILILDEPTAALSEGEASNLFERLRALKAEGVTILYISHRLPEIFALCDNITTLRDGHHVATQPIANVTPNDIVAHMVGREVAREEELLESQAAAAAAIVRETPLFECKNLTRLGEFEDITFAVYPGEIVGMAGLVGSGRSEIARVIFGLNAPTSGTMTLEGKPYTPRDPRAAIRAGVAMVPEDRRHQGLVMQLSVRENTT